ncbi:uncharacterized protein LOC123978573 [Micropterus dolomieu]|uniref:uncharacterized protein LOC123978573 n=1 Tax=Micropterus dolomieu TaxID=147949 RepID=UPI001E8E9674|nr:uncharacterized protein LOC123978573 [Micropterus dolomieu]
MNFPFSSGKEERRWGFRVNNENISFRQFFLSSTMADIPTVAALCLLWKSEIHRKTIHRHVRVHETIRRCTQLLQELRLDDATATTISQVDTNYRRSVSAAECLSICLRYFATGDSLRTIANSFRVGVSTVSKIVPDVATTIWDCFVEEFMALPNTEEWRSVAEKFEEQWNFLLDDKHVIVKAPASSGSQFFNYKGTFSLVLLAVVDA